MTIDYTKPISTRNGRAVEIIYTCPDKPLCDGETLVVLVTDRCGTRDVVSYQPDGTYDKSRPSDWDLVNVETLAPAGDNFRRAGDVESPLMMRLMALGPRR